MRFRLSASALLVFSALTANSYADNLKTIYEAAVENDPVMRAAEAQYRSQVETSNIARGALLPQIRFNAGATYADNDQEVTKAPDPLTELTGTSRTKGTNLSAGVTLTQQLLNLNSWYTFKGSKLVSQQAELEFIQNQQDLVRRTVTAYFAVLRAQSNLASSIAEEKAVKQQLDQMQQRFDVGLVAITDVNEAQAAYDMANVGLLANKGYLQIAYQALSVLTNQAHDKLDSLNEQFPVTVPEPADMDAWVNMSVENNPSLQVAKHSVTIAEYRAKAAKANHYPVIALNAGITKSENDGDREGYNVDLAANTITQETRAYGNEAQNASIGINLTVPLYSGGTISAQRRQAYAEYDMARESVTGNERSITQQTRSQFIAALTNMQTVSARKQAIVSAKSALDAIQAGYNVGTRNIVDVLNAQRNLFAAERDYANSRYDYILSIVELKYLAGTLSTEDIDLLNQWTLAE